jgi:hypothetical protein
MRVYLQVIATDYPIYFITISLTFADFTTRQLSALNELYASFTLTNPEKM